MRPVDVDYRHESVEVRRLLAEGWRYSTRGMVRRDQYWHPHLVWRRAGAEHRRPAPLMYLSERAAWLWCDSWSTRALHWDHP